MGGWQEVVIIPLFCVTFILIASLLAATLYSRNPDKDQLRYKKVYECTTLNGFIAPNDFNLFGFPIFRL